MAQSLHASVCPKLEVITMVSIPQVPEQTLVTIAQMIAPRLRTIIVLRGAWGLFSCSDNNDPIAIPIMEPCSKCAAAMQEEEDMSDEGAAVHSEAEAKNEKGVTAKNEKGVTAKNEKSMTAKNEKSVTAKNEKGVTAKNDKSTPAKNDKSTPVPRVMQKRVEYDTNGVTVSIANLNH